jgi:hypothetical protein
MLKRIAIYPLEFLKEFCAVGIPSPNEAPVRIEIQGIQIKLNSWRYMLFLEKGFKCVFCGLEASFMALEVDISKNMLDKYDELFAQKKILGHFNIYGKNIEGKEVLFTKDHIWPEGFCGRNCLDNFQTACMPCNTLKGSIPKISLMEAYEKNLVKQESIIMRLRPYIMGAQSE